MDFGNRKTYCRVHDDTAATYSYNTSKLQTFVDYHSIKAVLPAFVKGMSYDNMEIGNGMAAMDAYHRMCECADKPKELAKVRKDLLEYCRQDTLAMVKLLEVIVEKARG